MNIKAWCEFIGTWAKEKGWSSRISVETPFKVGEQLMLMTSELSEALEAYRDGRYAFDKIYFYQKDIEDYHDDQHRFDVNPERNKPEGLPTELADCVIRIMHFCHDNNIDLEEAMEIKMKYNYTRPYRHGNKLA